ncbi:hypothetical protein LTR62_004477 [Meristemomyces frigidus]|uniref:Uncharacterized protein n=1 Tax=Meristemomyces frigidus TaxID=1508187 RepID=A0AAN7TEL4_9PEZI|nr:hypothetical protein LTR62_004477 [Meristemomyces frigidus]
MSERSLSVYDSVPGSLTPSPLPGHRENLVVVRFLNAHLAERGIDTGTHAMLYRMVLMISAMGRDLDAVIMGKKSAPSVTAGIASFCGFVLEGCAVLKRGYSARIARSEGAETQLGRLAGMMEASGDRLSMKPEALLRILHAPTGNDARLFGHLATHFDESVYGNFLQLHRLQPENPMWSINEQLTRVREAIEKVEIYCRAADKVVRRIEKEYGTIGTLATKTGQPDIQANKPSVPKLRSKPDLTVDVARAWYMKGLPTSPIPNEPPRLPLLPFQREEVVQRSAPLMVQVHRNPTLSQSAGDADNHIAQRSHFRSATVANTGYTVDPALNPAPIAYTDQRSVPQSAVSACTSRRPSNSTVPRVFTGSFHELEVDVKRLRLHKVKTPEAQPTSRIATRSPTATTHGSHELETAAESSSVYPSSPTALQRRNAVVDSDARWKNRLIDGEVVCSRRPSVRPSPQSVQAIDYFRAGLASGASEMWSGREDPNFMRTRSREEAVVSRAPSRNRERTI